MDDLPILSSWNTNSRTSSPISVSLVYRFTSLSMRAWFLRDGLSSRILPHRVMEDTDFVREELL